MSVELNTVSDVKHFCQSMVEIQPESLTWADVCDHLEKLRIAKSQIEAIASNTRDSIKDVLIQRDAIDSRAEDTETRLRVAIANNQNAFIPLLEGSLSVLVKTANMYNGFCMMKLQQLDDLDLCVSDLEDVLDELFSHIEMIAEGDGDENDDIQMEEDSIQMAPGDEEGVEQAAQIAYVIQTPDDPEDEPDDPISISPSHYIPEIDSIFEDVLEHVPRIQAHDTPGTGRTFAENMSLIHGTSGRQY